MALSYEMILQKVLEIRKHHKKMGGRKLFYKLKPFLKEQGIKMGRDHFFTFLHLNGLKVRRRKRHVRTTYSYHRFRKYPNIIQGLKVTRSNQLWVSDITYWRLSEKVGYISFITDVFSHKVVGYYLSETLEASGSIMALKMALEQAGAIEGLIHHSDRGIQYCSYDYVQLLKKHGIQISMTENGDPRENSIAERLNGIIKGEYLLDQTFDDFIQARGYLEKSVFLYNSDRPHLSLDYKTPELIHETSEKTTKKWKNYYEHKEKNEYFLT